MIWPTGQDYKGEFLLDKLDGQGQMTYPDGRVFIRYWRSSRQNGDGAIYKKGKLYKQGVWNMGNMIKEIKL
ncbi:unnamed protein product [Paramecium sonneborni]|uniref:Uncharacterized protein n=1 Tax=Paramecium sonneborni TaxID=65129 RepID=A0A8S1NC98_9CILI|nr:unnamed protein product [Paramecium sonneborni]CAD8090238.1 unnamed protein product [Paramecium sonneborni]